MLLIYFFHSLIITYIKFLKKGKKMKNVFTILTILLLAACAKAPESIDGDMVFFNFDSAVITNDAREDLNAQALYMKENPDVTILMAGHCDERGSKEYNLALGALRAGNAAHVLIANGLESDRIKTVSYGKDKPQFLGTGEKVWSLNRNVTTTIIKK